MIPTIGRTVLYRLTPDQADAVNRRRKHAQDHKRSDTMDGSQIHVGNEVAAGQELPMTIVAVWGSSPESSVNGQVLLDGNDSLWVTSVAAGEGPGSWSWPVINRPEPIRVDDPLGQRMTADQAQAMTARDGEEPPAPVDPAKQGEQTEESESGGTDTAAA